MSAVMQLENICLFLGSFLPALRLTHDARCRLTPYPQTLCAIPWGCSFGVIFLLKDVLNILKCAVITASGPVLGARSAAPLATSINFFVSFLGVSGYWGKKSLEVFIFHPTYPSLRGQKSARAGAREVVGMLVGWNGVSLSRGS